MGQTFAWSWSKGTELEESVWAICGQATLLLSYISKSCSIINLNYLWSQEHCTFPAMVKFPSLALIQTLYSPLCSLQDILNKTSMSPVQI